MRVTAEGLERLACYGWPGNLRELANVLERATILSRVPELGPDAFDLPTREKAAPSPSSEPAPAAAAKSEKVPTLAAVQREHILRVLALTKGRIYGAGGAAQLLGLKPSTLQSRMKKLGIARQDQFIIEGPS
jgi:transcriptional regulator with GAF, ATPase, and Fis domain